MKKILKFLDKKLGYLIFLLESHPLGNFFSISFNISLKSISIFFQLLRLSLHQSLKISKANLKDDKPLFWKNIFNKTNISFYPDLRTGFVFSVRPASDTSKKTLKKLLDVFEEVKYSDDDEEIRSAQDKTFRILYDYNNSMLIRRPFYRFSKEKNGEVHRRIVPFRISQLNALIVFISIDILGLSISLTYDFLIKSLLIFLLGLGVGCFLF